MHSNNKKDIFCFNCKHFFITHDRHRRWGCRIFGFKSRMIPSIEVFASTGMKCAYKVAKKRINESLVKNMPIRRK